MFNILVIGVSIHVPIPLTIEISFMYPNANEGGLLPHTKGILVVNDKAVANDGNLNKNCLSMLLFTF